MRNALLCYLPLAAITFSGDLTLMRAPTCTPHVRAH